MKFHKFTLLLSCIALLSFSACDDDDNTENTVKPASNVPEAVVNTFTKQYPDAKNVKWETDKTGYYVAEFDGLYGTEIEAWYKTSDGSWAMTSSDYGVDDFLFPAPISVAFNKTAYATWNIKDITYYEYPDANKSFYLYEVTKSGQPDAAVMIYNDGTSRDISPWTDPDITPDTNLTSGTAGIPDTVTNAFTQQYPDAQNVKWETDKTGYYVAEFDGLYGTEIEAWYKISDGSWAMTSSDYGVDDFLFPAPISVAFNKTAYATWHIEDITYYEYPENSKSFYLYEVTKNGQPDTAVLIYNDGTSRDISPWTATDITPDTTL
ncbi:MAG: PepSY-like domain-containing protein [Paramuribaculum sp.]|nr:PepSY-like domain-containing protein [Paramuribaculum sp.]